MRILQVAPPQFAVPPKTYGPEQLQVHYLTEALVAAGHDVTLYATADSTTSAKLLTSFPTGSTRDFFERDLLHCVRLLDQLPEVDIVHSHSHCGFPVVAGQVPYPSLITTWDNSPVIRYFPERNYVVQSQSQARHLGPINVRAVIPLVIRAADYPFEEEKDDYLLFMGRVMPEKGAHLAIDLAESSGRRLKIAGPIPTTLEGIRWFRSAIQPRLSSSVEYLGPVYGPEKFELLARASCLVFPACREEPVATVLLEALACGTPVIGLRRGALPEVVVDGEVGYLADSVAELSRRIADLPKLSSRACRRRVEDTFSVERSVRDYLSLYDELA
jgi:glycosyltransferase involved in cell wall biosynthesis